MKRTFRKIPAREIFENYSHVEEFFKKKSFINSKKFWGYGIGRADNGIKALHENLNTHEGVYLTLFRLHNKKLQFEYFQICKDGSIQENVLDKFRISFNSIIEVKVSDRKSLGRFSLFISSTLFSKNLLICCSDEQSAKYYKSKIESNISATNSNAVNLMSKITSAHIQEKIATIMNTTQSDLAIGLSKDLIESVCKTILTKNSITFERKWGINRLVKECNNLIEFDLLNLGNTEKVRTSIKQIIAGLSTSIQGIVELRNELGNRSWKSR